MSYHYSPKNNAFYPDEMQEDYIKYGTWPEDAVKVDEEIYIQYGQNKAPSGKIRAPGMDGLPCWIDVPDLTEEEQSQFVRQKRNYLLSECDWSQLADVDDSIKQKFVPYRQLLRDIPEQPGFPFDVQWPSKPI